MHLEKNADKLVKTLRVLIQDQPGYLGGLCTAIGEAGGNIGEVKTVGLGLVRNTRDPDEFVEAVVRIAPTFGAINLEDVAAPDCFEIEARIQDALDFPVMHDDQHGTAVVVLASLLRACALSGLTLAEQTGGIIGIPNSAFE